MQGYFLIGCIPRQIRRAVANDFNLPVMAKLLLTSMVRQTMTWPICDGFHDSPV
jgi:hypothetical protein